MTCRWAGGGGAETWSVLGRQLMQQLAVPAALSSRREVATRVTPTVGRRVSTSMAVTAKVDVSSHSPAAAQQTRGGASEEGKQGADRGHRTQATVDRHNRAHPVQAHASQHKHAR